MSRIKYLVRPHKCHKILSLTKINYIMCISRQHVYCLNFISAYFKFNRFILFTSLRVYTEFPLLNQSVPADYDEELPFGIMPVLALRNTRLTYVDRELSMILFIAVNSDRKFFSVSMFSSR